MKDATKTVDFLLMATGFTYGYANIEQILGIIILIIQIIWFLLKIIVKVKDIANGGITTEEVDELKEELDEFVEEVKSNDDDT